MLYAYDLYKSIYYIYVQHQKLLKCVILKTTRERPSCLSVLYLKGNTFLLKPYMRAMRHMCEHMSYFCTHSPVNVYILQATSS